MYFPPTFWISQETDFLSLLQHTKKYKVTKVRVRFPDGIVLQGNFAGHERAQAVAELVRFCLDDATREFKLTNAGGSAVDLDSEQTLLELGFVPSVLLNLRWNDSFKGSGLNESLLAITQPL